jgi:hypothetical protein
LPPAKLCAWVVTAGKQAAFLREWHHVPISALKTDPYCPTRRDGGIGFSIFLFATGAIRTFAVEVDTSAGFNIDTVGIIEEDGLGGW